MNYTEYILNIINTLNKKESYGLDDIKEIIRNANYGMVDEIGDISDFPDGSNTILYSGKIGSVSTHQYVLSVENVRIIDKTTVGTLLEDKRFKKIVAKAIENDILAGVFNPEDVRMGLRDPDPLGAEYLKFVDDVENVTTSNLDRVVEKATEAFNYEPTQGAWAIASAELIKLTPPDSHIYCVVSNADTSRTWGQVEVVTAIENLPDSQKIGETTVGDLKKLVKNDEADVNKKYADVWNELKNESKVYDDILTRAGGDVTDSGKLLTTTNGDPNGVVKMLNATGNDVDGSVRLLNVSEGDVDGAIKVLNKSSGDIDSAVDIINRSGKNTSNALGVIDAAKGDVKGAIKTLDVTSNNHADAVKMLKSASGDVDGAINVFKKVGKDADIASAVLNKSNGDAVKALESIDTAHHSAIVYLNDDGVEIGHSYKNTGLEGILPDDIPSESAFSIRRADLESLPGDASVSGKIPMYEKLSAADQIQVKYIESKRLKGEYADVAVISVGFDADGKSNVRFDPNGIVASKELDAGAIRYDMDMNGKINVSCRDLADGSASWKAQIGDMIHDTRIESINGVDRVQFSKLDDALKNIDVDDTSKIIGDAIGKIPSKNTNPMRFVTDLATGRNQVADSVKIDPISGSKIGARVGVAMAALDMIGDYGDIIDAAKAYGKFATGLKNGDYVEASYELGEWGARTAGSTLAGMGAGYVTGVFLTALAAGGTAATGGVALLFVVGVSVVASTAGSELGAALWDDLNYRINGYGKRDHTKNAMVLSVLSKVGIRDNEGDDVIEGTDWKDEFDGGTGNDTLHGGSGSDKYIFRKGDGNDEIYDQGWNDSHNDKIIFESGVHASDVTIDRIENDLIIAYGSGDGIVVRNHFLGNDYLIESIVFSDGDSWDIGEMAEILQNIIGTEEGDYLKGYVKSTGYYDNEIFHAGAGDDLVEAYTGDDLIYGEDGTDALYGQRGNDTIIGGTGDDYLCGGQGDDIYIYNMGDGFDFIEDNGFEVYNSDKIVLGEGFSVDKVGMERRENDLIIQLSDNDFIMVKNAYNEWNDGKGFVENIVFSDGHVLRPEDIANRANVHMGSDDDDNMHGYKKAIGYNNDEVFIGGAGGDWIHAYDGDDTVCGDDGGDVIYGEDGNDVLFGGAGEDHIDGGRGDDFIRGDDDKDRLSGGEGMDIIYGGDGKDIITGDSDDDILYGEAGDDEIGGGHGNDAIYGGKGNDLLMGDVGDDAYFFDIGDGHDVIEGWLGEDRIIFGGGINFRNTSIERVADDLVICYGDNDRILVYGAYLWDGSQRFLENIQFSDGTVLGKEAVNHEASVRYGTEDVDEMNGYNGNCGYDINETLYGYGGNDIIHANEGNDIIYGGEGNDSIAGGYGDDLIYGESGDDELAGDDGDDTYFLNIGDGLDTIVEWTGDDWIVFGEGITFDNTSIERVVDDLVIQYGDKDRVLVYGAYLWDGSQRFLENIQFSDGTVLGKEAVNHEASVRYGTEDVDEMNGYNGNCGYDINETLYGYGGNDIIHANEGNDIIYGGEGNDSIAGGYGDDLIYGEAGNDELAGDDGDDTYFLNIGDGSDTIIEWTGDDWLVFGEGITFDNTSIERVVDDLVIRYGDNDRVLVYGAYLWDGSQRLLENIEFSDGTVLDKEAINHEASIRNGSDNNDSINGYNGNCGYDVNETLYGYGGDDIFYANEGNDTIYGGEGNDTLNGGDGDDHLLGEAGDDMLNGDKGDDAYFFNQGDGIDIINEWYGDDRIIFGSGILIGNIFMERDGDHLVIRYSDQDSVTVNGAYQYGDGAKRVEQMELKDNALYNINYSTVSLDLVESYLESVVETEDDFSDAQEEDEINDEIIDIPESDTESTECATDDTFNSSDDDNETESATELMEDTCDDEISDLQDSIIEEYADIDSEESDTDLFTSEDIDTVIESIIESGEEYSSEESGSDSYDYDDSEVDNMVSLAVQDMSESSEDNVCDSDDNNSSDSDSNSEQLWVEE